MNIELLDQSRIPDFTAYCRAHRAEVDDSFLYDGDLDAFEPGEESPTVMAWEDGRLVGAASLILDKYMRRGNRARFRIFHCQNGDASLYGALFQAILPLVHSVRYLDCFTHDQTEPLRHSLQSLGFVEERQSNLLIRDCSPIGEVHLPAGFSIDTYIPGKDAAAWCAVRNEAFATLKGSETPITEAMADQGNADALPGGALLLRFGPDVVGIVRTEDNIEGPIANIGPLAIAPACQGRGFGRMLLRAALLHAREQGFDRAILCVNGDNTPAMSLYLQEGFQLTETVVCYRYDMRSQVS